MERKCKHHGMTEFALNSQKKYVCKKCRSEKTVASRVIKKKRILKELNVSGCSFCGYNKCLAALEFHHLDPSEKDIKHNIFNSRSFEHKLNEYKKCIVLCSNCHREEHERIRNEKKYK